MLSVLQNNGLVVSNQPNTPAIRFRGFTEPWRKENISRRVSYGKGRGYSKADIKENGTPIILYGTMYTQYSTNIDNVTSYADIRYGSLLSKGNEVIVPASGETAEDIARASAVHQSNVILGGDLNVLYPNDDTDSSFLALELTYGRSHFHLVKKAQGISVVHLHNTDIDELEIAFPTLPEQQKIGDFFHSQDETINAAARQITKLKTLKQACLEQMFVYN